MALTLDGTTGITTSGSSSSGGSGVSTNTALGGDALKVNEAGGTNNTAIGYQALDANTTGDQNTAVGDSALGANTTASYSTAVGFEAGNSQTSGGDYNTFIGYRAGKSTTGDQNTFLGKFAGNLITTGTQNTIIGAYNGNQGGFDIRTASNYIVLSDGGGTPRAWIGAGNSNDLFRVGTVSTSTSSFMHQISYSQASRSALGVTNDSASSPSGIAVSYPNSADTASTNIFLSCANSGGARINLKNDGGIANFSGNNVNLSDRREKTNFAPAKNYLETICAIPVQTFNYIDQDMEEDGGLTLGVVAQDVQEVAPELVMESNWGTQEEPKMRLSIYQTDLQYALMKAIQELSAQVTALQSEVNALKGSE